MENLERLNLLKNEGKLIVEVRQNNKLVNIWEDEKQNILQLTAFLYRKTLLKSNISIRYTYNYNDLQTIKIINKYTNFDNTITKTEYIFYNIPTKMGFLDVYKLEKEVLTNAK